MREEWDETSEVAVNRKIQLEAMLTESHRVQAKKDELEAWLSRTEAKFGKMHSDSKV